MRGVATKATAEVSHMIDTCYAIQCLQTHVGARVAFQHPCRRLLVHTTILHSAPARFGVTSREHHGQIYDHEYDFLATHGEAR